MCKDKININITSHQVDRDVEQVHGTVLSSVSTDAMLLRGIWLMAELMAELLSRVTVLSSVVTDAMLRSDVCVMAELYLEHPLRCLEHLQRERRHNE